MSFEAEVPSIIYLILVLLLIMMLFVVIVLSFLFFWNKSTWFNVKSTYFTRLATDYGSSKCDVCKCRRWNIDPKLVLLLMVVAVVFVWSFQFFWNGGIWFNNITSKNICLAYYQRWYTRSFFLCVFRRRKFLWNWYPKPVLLLTMVADLFWSWFHFLWTRVRVDGWII